MAVADELVTILGVDLARDALSKLEGFKKGVDSVKKTLIGLSVTVTGAAAAMNLMVKGAADEAMELQKLSDKTGLSTDALQEWGYAAKAAGGDAKAVQNDLVGLQQKFMGTGKSAEKSLLSMADSFSKMSGSRAQIHGKAWGLSDDTIALLRKGRDGIEQLRKEAHALGGIIPSESIKRAAEFKRQMGELQFAFKGISTQVAIAMMPALSRVVELFKGWIGENRQFISLGLEAVMTGLVNGLERFWKMLGKTGDFFRPLTDKLKAFSGGMSLAEFATHLITGALAGLLLIFSPIIAKFVLIGAAVVAISLIFEDFFTYLEGGESVIGDLFNAFEQRWPGLAAAVKKIGAFVKENFVDALKAAWDAIKAYGEAWGEIVGIVLDGVNALAGPVVDFFATFDEKFPALFELLKACGKFIRKFIGGAFEAAFSLVKIIVGNIIKLIEDIGGGIGKIVEGANWIADKLGFGTDKKGEAPSAGKDGASVPAPAGLPKEMPLAPSHARSETRNTYNTTVNQNIATSDPRQAADAAVHALPGQPQANPGPYAPPGT